MPRLFTGLSLSPSVSQMLAFKQGGLFGAKWVDPVNFHITMTFAGDMRRGQAREVERAFDEVEQIAPFDIELTRLDAFGGDRPRALIVHADGGEALRQLKTTSDGIMRRAGVDFDHRKFVPHVTLARLKQCSSHEVARHLSVSGFETIKMRVREFCLYSSRDSRGGGPYHKEASISLDEFGESAFEDDKWNEPEHYASAAEWLEAAY